MKAKATIFTPDKKYQLMAENPKVSVSIITYNHEKYIGKAIDSVLEQQTDFDYEIIIGDDCSTDSTKKILQEYQNKHPKKIQLILHPQRYKGIPGRLNNITNLYACRGKYVAMLDGDDYWLDTGKLQSQVDFMDSHKDYVAVSNDAIKVNTHNKFIGGYYSDTHSILKEDASLSHKHVLQAGWCLTQTSSLLFRNKILGDFPDWFWNIVSADYGLILLLSKHGNIKYFKKARTAYRIHQDSFTAKHYVSKDMLLKKVRELQLLRKLFLPYKSSIGLLKNLQTASTLNRRISMFKYGYASCIRREGNQMAAIRYLIKSSFSNFSFIYFFGLSYKKLRKSLCLA